MSDISASAASLPTMVRQVMTAPVISITPETTVRDAARLLLDKHISAVPVIDKSGNLEGVVSEGDLLGRSEQDWRVRQDWWLAMLAGAGKQPAAAFSPKQLERPVEDVMHGPVLTVEADTPVKAAAEMLLAHRIKRLPVLSDGKVVGIVSRADLLRAVVGPLGPAGKALRSGGLTGFVMTLLQSLMGGYRPAFQASKPPVSHRAAALTAQEFRNLEAASKQAAVDKRRQEQEEVDLGRQREVKAMLQEHLNSEMWETLLDHARESAARGEKEFLLLRFPSELCSDEARKIDVRESGWEKTLRGEAADLYDRWGRELKPAGFGLQARVLDYPGGKPGDVGLFLFWGGGDE